MKILHIYPTSRSIRQAGAALGSEDALLPSMMRIDEFLKRALLIPDRVMVDSQLRVMLLHEASSFESFEKLRIDRGMVKFFSKSDAFFKFFEELSQEGVSIDDLYAADAYALFDEHLDTLKLLYERYGALLDSRGLSDKAFLPAHYRLSEGFIEAYDRFELHLEGYLSLFELRILTEIAGKKSVIVHIHTNRFNRKMVERFAVAGIELAYDRDITFDLGSGRILVSEPARDRFDALVLSTDERLSQIAVAIEQIELMVRGGIAPEDIVLIVPDESIVTHLDHYDRYNNFNFAMGFEYRTQPYYKKLDAIYSYWQGRDANALKRLAAYCIAHSELFDARYERMGVEKFFALLGTFGLDGEGESPLASEPLEQHYANFVRIFREVRFAPKEWLYMWLRQLDTVTIDDNRGGKVTVMGALESRGVRFKGVVIIDFNEDIVPATTSKDSFLSTAVREFAGLPTRYDRESLQKYLYSRILSQAEKSVIIYSTSGEKLPSKFLYELGLHGTGAARSDLSLLYAAKSLVREPSDPVAEHFDPFSHIWSSTKLKLFLECKRAFYYRYIARLRVPREENDINEGALLHDILYRLFEDTRGFDDADTIRERFETVSGNYLREYREQWGDDSRLELYRRLWQERLEGFFGLQAQRFGSGWGVLYREHKVAAEIGGLRFEGKIDRVDSDGSTLCVIDYKTSLSPSLNRSRNLEKLTDFQMNIYDRLLRFHGYEPQRLEYIKLFEEGHAEEIKEFGAKTELLFEHIVALKQTTSFRASRCEDTKLCTYCDYRLNCERGVYM